MLDFGEGWTWFVSGFTTTALVAVLVVVLAKVADRQGARTRSTPTTGT